jgi:hypothetical protein
LQTTQQALRDVTDRLASLENGSGDTGANSGNGASLEKYNQQFWSDLYLENKSAVEANDIRKDQLNSLMYQLYANQPKK